MYPASFEYLAPTTLDDAIAQLDAHGDDGKVLAGGQSLIPLMKLRFAAPAVLIDINGVADLNDSITTADGGLTIGARVRHKDCERSEHLKGRYAMLGRAAPQISDPIVRNHGTVCGSLAHADPQGDWASVVTALGGHVVAQGSRGRRTIPVSEFVTGPFQNVLAIDGIVVEAVIPAPKGVPAGGYLKLERRVGDFATAGVAVALERSGETITRAGIALTGAGPATIDAADAAGALVGGPLTAATI